MRQLTLKELAPQLGGNYWEKGDRKRIYLREGYNTKKMKTTTYVTQTDGGEFIVCCYIDCPSQNYGWISSQENIIKERVRREIDYHTADTYYYIKHNKKESYYGTDGIEWENLSDFDETNLAFIRDDIEEILEDFSNDYEIKEITSEELLKVQNEQED